MFVWGQNRSLNGRQGAPSGPCTPSNSHTSDAGSSTCRWYPHVLTSQQRNSIFVLKNVSTAVYSSITRGREGSNNGTNAKYYATSAVLPSCYGQWCICGCNAATYHCNTVTYHCNRPCVAVTGPINTCNMATYHCSTATYHCNTATCHCNTATYHYNTATYHRNAGKYHCNTATCICNIRPHTTVTRPRTTAMQGKARSLNAVCSQL